MKKVIMLALSLVAVFGQKVDAMNRQAMDDGAVLAAALTVRVGPATAVTVRVGLAVDAVKTRQIKNLLRIAGEREGEAAPAAAAAVAWPNQIQKMAASVPTGVPAVFAGRERVEISDVEHDWVFYSMVKAKVAGGNVLQWVVRGINRQAVDSQGQTYLMKALVANDVCLANYLVGFSRAVGEFDANVRNARGQTALMVAIEHGHAEDVIQGLIEAGCQGNDVGADDCTSSSVGGAPAASAGPSSVRQNVPVRLSKIAIRDAYGPALMNAHHSVSPARVHDVESRLSVNFVGLVESPSTTAVGPDTTPARDASTTLAQGRGFSPYDYPPVSTVARSPLRGSQQHSSLVAACCRELEEREKRDLGL